MSGWDGMDPNSQNQLWSHWTFTAIGGRAAPYEDVVHNVAEWLKMGFGSVARARVQQQICQEKPFQGLMQFVVEAQVEGAAAHDPDYEDSVRKQWRAFCQQGFGSMVLAETEVKILAGDVQDGKPPAQLLVVDGRISVN